MTGKQKALETETYSEAKGLRDRTKNSELSIVISTERGLWPKVHNLWIINPIFKQYCYVFDYLKLLTVLTEISVLILLIYY